MSAWLNVIGIGEDGIEALPRTLRALIERAELIIGGERHLAMVPHAHGEKKSWASPLSLTLDDIWSRRGRPVVVLATGDPMHFGIGVALAKRVPAEEMAVYPHISAFSLAAARMLWSLSEVECLTIHGRPLDLLASAFAPKRKLLLLSHDGSSPTEVARRLIELGYGASVLTVLEHMGGTRERIYAGRADSWSHPRAADLNTLAVECHGTDGARALSQSPGLPDEAFQHDGQLTKREIRAATLSVLRPLPGQLLWDVGAGCGSIAIEWLRAHRSLSAIAIESDEERLGLIEKNMAALGTPHLKLVKGTAPQAYDGLPDPDAVFIGGGLADAGVIEQAWRRLKTGGRLVANAVTAEGEAHLFAWRGKLGGEMTRLSVARLAPVGELHGWKPLMPVTQYWVDKT
ncbi:precorrin-6y C5,15-methyltransferase (decarboxylating) subunit CbiE [Dongia deserti]|uniref:precorrin-6y C5,15-methyltransferase (decarboxylating) subunit CbiE n=1 Tax=Dongia deserti TaxID=2268030 RepID=UPI000E64D4C7|nr:precorrin-6y C5,15-methyltransferase (decarboxylating) subunit CbiE [Dongia deserti]